MKASELRIGNLVEYQINDELEEPKNFWVENVIDAEDLGYINKSQNYRPIQITKEWLLKFGFKFHVVYENKIWMNESITLFEKENSEYELSWGRHIKYVHELQNIHYAFTGTEL